MRNLLVLWDPANPLVPAASVVQALRKRVELRVRELTFEDLGHPTLPNRAFRLEPLLQSDKPDGLLWIEGGPFPDDLYDLPCPKACWLTNTHLEPSLQEDVGSGFDRVFSTLLRDTADERAHWLPLAAGRIPAPHAPEGVSVLLDDPKPPCHGRVEQVLLRANDLVSQASVPVVVCLGNAGRVHPMLFDALGSGAAVVVDPQSDVRGIAHVGDHLEVFPSEEELPGFLGELLRDEQRLSRLASRGPSIVQHLHEPELRAAEILRGLWGWGQALSGATHHPKVSVLVTCYRYLRRLKICLESLARQSLPSGSLEIVVADPGSPDGLAEHLHAFAQGHPELRVVHVPIDPRYHRNRGVGINRAFDASTGAVVIGIDGDIVFPSHLIGYLEERVRKDPNRVFGVRRRFLNREVTEQILAGNLDPFQEFEVLSRSEGDGEAQAHVGVLGYCQATTRAAFAHARYPEEFDMVNQSDIVFVERLAKEAAVRPDYLVDQTVLHLWHPRNWMGTVDSL